MTTLAGALGALLSVTACSKDTGPDTAPGATAVATAAPAAGASAGATARVSPGADQGKIYGAGVHQTESVPIATLLADPQAYAGKSVRVEGTVTDVCPRRGCWFELAGASPGQKLRFKVRDGEMVFPMDAKGKFAVAEGVVAVQPLSLEETRKYLAYQAREYGSEVDPDSVTEPMTIVRLDGTGAQIRDRE